MSEIVKSNLPVKKAPVKDLEKEPVKKLKDEPMKQISTLFSKLEVEKKDSPDKVPKEQSEEYVELGTPPTSDFEEDDEEEEGEGFTLDQITIHLSNPQEMAKIGLEVDGIISYEPCGCEIITQKTNRGGQVTRKLCEEHSK